MTFREPVGSLSPSRPPRYVPRPEKRISLLACIVVVAPIPSIDLPHEEDITFWTLLCHICEAFVARRIFDAESCHTVDMVPITA